MKIEATSSKSTHIKSDIQTSFMLTIPLFKLDELLMRLRSAIYKLLFTFMP